MRAQGMTRMMFWSDVLFETAHALYRHLGATQTGERRHLGGDNDVWEFGFELELCPDAFGFLAVRRECLRIATVTLTQLQFDFCSLVPAFHG